jgi:hypothetical protein
LEASGRRDLLGFDAASVNRNKLSSARWAWHELRQAGHPSTDIFDLNVR